MKQAGKWMTIVAPIAVVAIIILSILSIPTLSAQAAGFHGIRGGGGMDGHGFHERGMMVNHSFLWVPFLLGFLAKVGMILAGLILWVKGKSKGAKIASGIFLALGLLALLPSILATPLLIVLGYLLYKSIGKREANVQELMTAADFVVPSYTSRDFLDEWESKIRREVK